MRVIVHDMPREQWEKLDLDIKEDDIRSETATARDYLLFMQWIVEEKDGKGSES